jgi:hypothetical protein
MKIRRDGLTSEPNAPRAFVLEDYKRWYPKTARMFLRNLKRYDALPIRNAQDGQTIGVVVVPWVSTAVPWYAIMLAIGLARRGCKVVLLWDDTGFPELHLEQQNNVIQKVLGYVEQHLPVVRTTEQAPATSQPSDASLLDGFAAQNVTWISRGASSAEADLAMTKKVRASLTRSLPMIRSALAGTPMDCLVIPGGVYGTSGLWRHEAEALGIRAATFDTDRRIGQLCVSGVAAQNSDIPRAFEAVWDGSEAEHRDAIEIGQAEFQRRLENSDSYGFQTQPASGRASDATETPDSAGVLLPLNVEWDTAALGRHLHFANTVEWLTSTIAVILEHDRGPVIVRQHPSERRKLQRSRLDIATLLAEKFGDDPRVQFVAAADPVSSYDLLHSARLVLPYVSTIAIEAAAMGKPVLVSGASYYSRLGFVWSAASREEYFELLRRGLDGSLGLLPDQTDRAWVCYYLTAVRNRIPTDFTPHPDDFWDWIRRSPDVLFDDVEVSDMLAAIDGDEPISLRRHRRISGLARV